LNAVCLQHEIDHLDGVLFTDKVDPATMHKVQAAAAARSEEVHAKEKELARVR
jgi:peptide deformylase